jgi:hypothetical protein
MPRRSAYRICLPNLAALGATSVGIPRRRRAAAAVSDVERSSSETTATSTHVGTGRDTVSAEAPNSRPSMREMPTEIPTPGYRSVPTLARLSYRPPEQIDPLLSKPRNWVSYTVPV